MLDERLKKIKVDKIPSGYKELKEVRNEYGILRSLDKQKKLGNLLKFKTIYREHFVGTSKRSFKIYKLYIRKKPNRGI